MQLDPRVQSLIAGLSPHEKLQTLLVVAGADPAHLSEVLAHVVPASADVNELVGGSPLFHWMGKSESQIRLECGDDKDRAETVLRALDDRNFHVPERTRAMSRLDFAEDRAERRVIVPSAAPADAERSVSVGLTGSASEQTFGDDQFPASELWGLSDNELLDIPGISQAAIGQIRAAQNEYLRRQTEADRLRGVTAETAHLGRIPAAPGVNPAATPQRTTGGRRKRADSEGGGAPGAPEAAAAPEGGTAPPPSDSPAAAS